MDRERGTGTHSGKITTDETRILNPKPVKPSIPNRILLFCTLIALTVSLYLNSSLWLQRVQQLFGNNQNLSGMVVDRASWEISRFETGYKLINNWPVAPEDTVLFTPTVEGVSFELIPPDGRPALFVQGNHITVLVLEFDDACNTTRLSPTTISYAGHLVRVRDTALNHANTLILKKDGVADYFVITNNLACGIKVNLDYPGDD